MPEIIIEIYKIMMINGTWCEVSENFKHMKQARLEQIQDTHEHDYIALCVGKLKKYKHMKQAMPEIIIETHKIMMINGTW